MLDVPAEKDGHQKNYRMPRLSHVMIIISVKVLKAAKW